MADHNTLSGGVSCEVTGGTVLIGGVACEIQSGMTLVNGVAKEITFAPPVEVEAVFSDNTWEQIVAACQAKYIPDTWNVGDSKTMAINGISYPIIIIGKNHDVYSDGSGTAPLTFRMNECYHQLYSMHGSAGYTAGWPGCDMRNSYLPAILAQMPSVVRNSIREVDKETTNGKGATAIVLESDKLFLLSESEMTGSRCVYQNINVGLEGSRYEYFLNTSDYNVAMMENVSKAYWLRTASTYGGTFRTWSCKSSKFHLISPYPDPKFYEGNDPVDGYHIAPAFCF